MTGKQLFRITENLLDLLLFAYRAKQGIEDATSTLLNQSFKHLDGSYLLTFHFNTVQLHI